MGPTMLDRFQAFQARWDRRRMEAQLERLLPELYRTARALTDQRADAEDLVHDACVKAIGAAE